MKAWLFAGQGAQRPGMGEALFDRFPEFVTTADRILGESVRALCLDDPDGRLNRTRWTQPALYVVNALASAEALAEGPGPDLLAGHSLGEYNALLTAGCFDFETGLRIVRRRGELMGEADGGAMLAVVGLTPDAVRALLDRCGAADVDLANLNTATQVVVSGPAESVRAVRTAVRATPGARCVPLVTSGAFHSRHMRPAQERFAAFLDTVEFRPPRIPVIANVTGRPYPADRVADLLARQIAAPVRWHETLRELLRRGVTEAREFGPRPMLRPMWESVLAEPEAVQQPQPQREPGPVEARVPASPARVPAAVSVHAAVPGDATAPAAPEPELVRDPAAARLGSAEFRQDHGVRYAYLAGSMFRGVSSVELVARLGRAGLRGYFGAGGLDLGTVEKALTELARTPGLDGRYGVNLLHDLTRPGAEDALTDLLLRHDVRHVEAAAFTTVTPAIVRYRFTGAHRAADGAPVAVRTLVAKCSRPEVAAHFMAPPAEELLRRLVSEGLLTPSEADAARGLPVAQDICVEGDSAGHTDGGVSLALVPTTAALAERLTARHGYARRLRVGACGGLGTPEAVAAAFVLGADFVVTGSVNQCSPQAGTSDAVKDLLAAVDVQDTAYAPAGDLFELGSRVQVVRKGTLFAARANKLYQLYRGHGGLDDLDQATRTWLERDCLRAPLDQAWKQTCAHYRDTGRVHELERAERDPRHRMALLFKSYFARTNRAAQEGDPAERANYQVHCGPAAGAFNRCVRGTALEPWPERHVERIADLLMTGAARVLGERLAAYAGTAPGDVPHHS
ncbi:polyketide biosynthesis protein PksE [Streptomyces humidus]|uniref:[acyl-carrier-protein] S-malonyltransferase n=1 Tax=Streptomyces humidus TaxID=52259 RepID=A0A918FY97_9ACTN|nr:ACP S-malonyltransferase [Streptomyces humidus]GGR96732.1 polyketide biosynthesis protein PksE [Streptomyces humidus]